MIQTNKRARGICAGIGLLLVVIIYWLSGEPMSIIYTRSPECAWFWVSALFIIFVGITCPLFDEEE